MVRPPVPSDHPTRRAREVNWGDKTRIAGNERKTLAWVSVERPSPMVVYATATIRGGPDVAFVVNIEWGHGGASVDQDYPVIHRLRVPLAASMVKVSGRLLDGSGNPPPQSVSGEISVFIAPGSDGDTLRNTRWVSQQGASGTFSDRPERVMRVEGFNAGATNTWVMVFDGRGENGDFPTIVAPVRIGRRFVLRRFDSHGFRSSVLWRASSTPLVLTKDPSASLRIDAELLL